MHPKICVSLPVYNDDLNQLNKSIISLHQYKPDIVELRFDFICDTNKITNEFIRQLKTLFSKKIDLIFTLRDFKEGGNLKLSQNEKKFILETLVENTPKFLDLEANSPLQLLSQIIKLTIKKNVNLILSNHDYKSTLSFNEGKGLHKSILNKVKPIYIKLDEKFDNIIYKYVFMATKFQDNLLCLKLSDHLSKKNHKNVCFCMGELGFISRILCVKFGSSFTYSSFSEKVAPGQIHIEDMTKVYQLLSRL